MTGTRQAVELTDVTHIHARMQLALYNEFVGTWGADNVSSEQIMSSGRLADLVFTIYWTRSAILVSRPPSSLRVLSVS